MTSCAHEAGDAVSVQALLMAETRVFAVLQQYRRADADVARDCGWLLRPQRAGVVGLGEPKVKPQPDVTCQDT